MPLFPSTWRNQYMLTSAPRFWSMASPEGPHSWRSSQSFGGAPVSSSPRNKFGFSYSPACLLMSPAPDTFCSSTANVLAAKSLSQFDSPTLTPKSMLCQCLPGPVLCIHHYDAHDQKESPCNISSSYYVHSLEDGSDNETFKKASDKIEHLILNSPLSYPATTLTLLILPSIHPPFPPPIHHLHSLQNLVSNHIQKNPFSPSPRCFSSPCKPLTAQNALNTKHMYKVFIPYFTHIFSYNFTTTI